MIGFSSIKKLFGGLAKTREDLTRRISEAVRGGRIDEGALEALEEALIAADVGVGTAGRVVAVVREQARGLGEVGERELRELVAAELAGCLEELAAPSEGAGPGPGTVASAADPAQAARGRAAAAPGAGSASQGVTSGSPAPAGSPSGAATSQPSAGPHVVMVVGVNGGGKTTTVAKLAARLKGEGRSVLLAAADTFRAAATEQLVLWAERAGTPVITHEYGADPGAVAFDAARAARSRGAEVLIIDTAGRLHTKNHLMQELEKVARVVGREIAGAPHEVLLVLDATTGQNGLAQAKEFARCVTVTGLVLTKLDGTARGGVALAIARDLKIPIRYVGVGEGMDDLLDFDPRAFAASLVGDERAEP